MLSRGPRLAHICLRCRRDLARQLTPSQPSLSLRVRTAPHLRYQSTAAVALTDDTYDEPQEEAEHLSVTKDDPIPKPKRRKHRNKRFKPTPTAALGVESFGKPSEVIVLPSRDRVIPTSTETDGGPEQHLSEVLEEERGPVEWRAVQKHIDSLRPSFGEDEPSITSFSEEESKKLIDTLVKQFSRNQLVRYKFSRSTNKLQKGTGFPSKEKIAASIVKTIWGYRDRSLQPEDDVEEPGNIHTGQINIKNKDDLHLFWRDAKAGFEAVAKATQTVITAGEKGKPKITGIRANVERAKKSIAARRPRSTVLDLVGFGQAFFAEGKQAALEKLLTTIGADDAVVVRQSEPRKLRARHFRSNQEVVGRARRELWCAAETESFSRIPSVVAASKSQKLRLVPFYHASSVPWPTQAQQWGRLFRTGPEVPSSDEGSAFVWKGVKDFFSSTSLKKSRQGFKYSRSEMVARLGMNLHYNVETRAAEMAHDSSPSWFIDEVPMTAQLLASLPPYRAPEESTVSNWKSASASLEVRLILKPVALQSTASTIEVFLRGSDPSLVLAQPLNISRVTLTMEEKTLNITTPDAPIDTSFVRRLRQDLFVESTHSSTPMLLEQIGSYLACAREEKHHLPRFSPFVTLRIPSYFSKGDSQASGNKEPSEPSAPSEPSEHEYVLSSVDTVNYQYRSIPPHDPSDIGKSESVEGKALSPRPLLLQYATFKPYKSGTVPAAPDESPDSSPASVPPSLPSPSDVPERHELRIVEAPHWAPPAYKALRLDDLRYATSFVAERIAQLGRDLRKP